MTGSLGDGFSYIKGWIGLVFGCRGGMALAEGGVIWILIVLVLVVIILFVLVVSLIGQAIKSVV